MRHVVIMLVLGALGCGEKTPPEAVEASTPTEDAATATGTPSGDTAAAVDPLRDKLMALAVASECLRKGNTPPEQAAQTMLALYKAHGVDLETYTREMSKLASDPAFQVEIDRQTKDCPLAAPSTPEVVAAPPDTAAEPETAAPDTEPAPADTAIAVTPEAGGAEAGPDAVVAAADTHAEPETRAAAADSTPDTAAATPDTAVATPDTAVATPDTAQAPEVAQVPPEPEEEVSFTGTWSGQLYGGATPGNLRVVIKGRTITSAVATFGRTSVRLKGAISEKGSLTLGGTSGDDFMRISGTVQRTGRAMNGTWNGVVDRRRSNGRFILKR